MSDSNLLENDSVSGDQRCSRQRLGGVRLDERGIVRWSDAVQHERVAAMNALLEENHFVVLSAPEAGPYHMDVSVSEGRLWIRVQGLEGEALEDISLSLGGMRSLVQEYFSVCESYFSAMKGATADKVETFDFARRGLHNDGAAQVQDRLSPYFQMDNETARRLFTLFCVLQLRETGEWSRVGADSA